MLVGVLQNRALTGSADGSHSGVGGPSGPWRGDHRWAWAEIRLSATGGCSGSGRGRKKILGCQGWQRTPEGQGRGDQAGYPEGRLRRVSDKRRGRKAPGAKNKGGAGRLWKPRMRI